MTTHATTRGEVGRIDAALGRRERAADTLCGQKNYHFRHRGIFETSTNPNRYVTCRRCAGIVARAAFGLLFGGVP